MTSDLVQIQNPKTSYWNLIDRSVGRIVAVSLGRWDKVPVAAKTKRGNDNDSTQARQEVVSAPRPSQKAGQQKG